MLFPLWTPKCAETNEMVIDQRFCEDLMRFINIWDFSHSHFSCQILLSGHHLVVFGCSVWELRFCSKESLLKNSIIQFLLLCSMGIISAYHTFQCIFVNITLLPTIGNLIWVQKSQQWVDNWYKAMNKCLCNEKVVS